MSDDMRRLLAGYATGTLTDGERKALFEAALADEELFAAISDEEPLRELLSDTAARTELLARIAPAPVAFRERFAAWLRRPTVVAGFATAAVAVVVIALVPLMRDQKVAEPVPVARLTSPQLVPAPEPPRDAANAEAAPRPLQRAAAPKRKEEVESVVAIQPRLFTDAPVPEGGVVGGVAEHRVVQPAPAPVSATPPASIGMAALPQPSIQVSADTARLVTRTMAAQRAAALPRLTVLRRTLTGEYSEVDPAATVFSPGDTVRLRVDPPDSGLVSIQGATPQPIIQAVTRGRAFETGDILVGSQDMRLAIHFSTGVPAVRTLVNSLRASESGEAKAAQPAEITLRVKKP